MQKKRPTIEEEISLRFIEVMSDFTGIRKKFRYKKAFGEAIGMRQQEIIKVEHGSAVQYRHLVRMHELFGLNLNWIISGRGEKYIGKSNGQMSLEERVARIEKVIAASASLSTTPKAQRRKAPR